MGDALGSRTAPSIRPPPAPPPPKKKRRLGYSTKLLLIILPLLFLGAATAEFQWLRQQF